MPDLAALLGASGADLVRLVPELRERMPELRAAPPIDPNQERDRIFDGVGRLLTHLSQQHPLLVIIDDVQGADLPSALLLQFLAQALAQQPATQLLLLIACRTAALSTQSPLSHLLAGLIQPDGHMRLGGLNQAEVTHLVQGHANTEPPREVAAHLYRITEGNPLFLREAVWLIQRAEQH